MRIKPTLACTLNKYVHMIYKKIHFTALTFTDDSILTLSD